MRKNCNKMISEDDVDGVYHYITNNGNTFNLSTKKILNYINIHTN